MVELVITSKSSSADPENGRKAVGNIVIAMRNDLLGKTSLTPDDFHYTDVIEDK